MVLKYNTQQASSYISTGVFSLRGRGTSLLSRCTDNRQPKVTVCVNGAIYTYIKTLYGNYWIG